MRFSTVTLLKLIMILIVLFMMVSSSWEAISDRLSAYQDVSGNIQIKYPLALYLITLIVGAISLLVIPFIRNNILRVLLSLFLALSFATNYVANDVLSSAFSFQLFQVFMNSFEEVGFAFGEYKASIFKGAAAFLIVFIISVIKPAMEMPKLIRTAWWLPIGAVALTGYAFRYSNYYLEEFIPPTVMPAQIYYAATIPAKGNVPKNNPYNYDLVSDGIEKIVLIVDESVRGDYLQINQDIFDNTPYLEANKDRYANFGISASFTNCSAKTRLALRVGLRNSDIPIKRKDAFAKSTFWQYAKNAGYENVFIDGWQPLRSNHSWFGKFEEAFVDKRLSADINPFSTIDNRLAEILRAELKKPGKQFFFVEKIGMHAPYDQNIPEGDTYTPSKTSVPNPEILPDQRQKVIDYARGMKNRVDDFFKILLQGEEFENSLIIFTSDHGQSLYQAPYLATHCTKKKNTHWGEGSVPLIVFSDNENILEQYKSAAQKSWNLSHHENLFPTLLESMGFDKAQVAENYGLGLLDVTYTEQPYFISGSINRKRHRRIVIPENASPIGLAPEIE